MSITYQLHLDSGLDNTFATDLSASVLALRWQRGHIHVDDGIAAPTDAMFTLDAVGLSIPDWVGLRLRVRAVTDSLTMTLLVVRVVRVTQNLGRARPELTLWAGDALAELRGAQIALTSVRGQTSGALIGAVLNQSRLQPSVLTGRWRLAMPSHSQLGQTTRFVPPLSVALESGKTRFAPISGGEAYAVIAALTQAEGGVFFSERDGRLCFLERHTLLTRDTPALTLEDAPSDVVYATSDDLVNELTIRSSDQQFGQPNTVVWRSSQPILCAPNTVQAIALRWHDEQGMAVWATDLFAPLRGSDLRFGITPTTSSVALAQQISAVLVAQAADHATLEIRNPLPQAVYLLTGAVVRGTPIRVLPQAGVTLTDAASRARYGLHARTIQLPLLDNPDEVRARARYWLGRTRQPRTTLQKVVLDAQAWPAVLALELWSRVRLMFTLPMLTIDSFITAETHAIDRAGTRHTITWELLDADTLRYWRVGSRRLSQDARLAY